MDICCRLNYPKHVVMFPSMSTPKKCNNINYISCKASSNNTLEAQTGSSTNLYQVLSLDSEKVGLKEIKKAYRNMARMYHPDVVPASRKEESTKKFVEVQKAYETLSNPVSRQKYDIELGYLSRCGGAKSSERSNFCKDVWADQLSGLEKRSNNKKGRKRPTSYM